MDLYKDLLVEAGIPNLYEQDGIDREKVKIYGHIYIVGLEGGDYHAYITELDQKTNIAFGYVAWQDNEWGYINLDEYKTLPVILQETFYEGQFTYENMMSRLAEYGKIQKE